MISHIRGRLVEKNPTDVVIDCNGVGYLLHISLYTFSQLPKDENIQMFTHLLVREDAHTLFGFMTEAEREVFRLLITVSGVGANTARTMLSSLSPEEIVEAIASNDLKTIQTVKGVGVKTSQRLVLDLKDKIIKVYGLSSISEEKNNTNKIEALSALETLGFNRKKAEAVCDEIIKDHPQASAEMIIKQALKKL